MPVKPLPPNPNIDHLKHQARDLLRARGQRDRQAAQRIREFHPDFWNSLDAEIFEKAFQLSDAQLTIARERGFASWTKLRRRIAQPTIADDLNRPHHERIADPVFRRAVDLLDAGDAANLRTYLRERPELIRRRVEFPGENYFRNPSLLEFIAENPVRHRTLPPNIVEIAELILQAGAKDEPSVLNETLGLVSSGSVVRHCRVQIHLIDLLCRYGADPVSAVPAALLHGEFEAVDALIRNGAPVDLFVAAGLGHTRDVEAKVTSATARQRQLALAVACQFGHADTARILLDAGADPSIYNPPGAHAHSTPLHQAALGGHFETVRLLVERGASLDAKDTMWQGTPAGWAAHAHHEEIERYLRDQEQAQKNKIP